jgi:hypothetical protein
VESQSVYNESLGEYSWKEDAALEEKYYMICPEIY